MPDSVEDNEKYDLQHTDLKIYAESLERKRKRRTFGKLYFLFSLFFQFGCIKSMKLEQPEKDVMQLE